MFNLKTTKNQIFIEFTDSLNRHLTIKFGLFLALSFTAKTTWPLNNIFFYILI